MSFGHYSALAAVPTCLRAGPDNLAGEELYVNVSETKE
jgi:hypothetical protein